MAGAFFPYAEKQLGFDQPVSIIFQSDADNAQNILGKTAQYDPDEMSVTLFTDGRHPKDVLRSLSHELVHHTQNCRGEFDSIGDMDTSPGYAQRDSHLRGMEEEAYKLGNLVFRDWEDMFKQKATQLQERKLKKTLRRGLKKLLKEAAIPLRTKAGEVYAYAPSEEEAIKQTAEKIPAAKSWEQARAQDPGPAQTSAGDYWDKLKNTWAGDLGGSYTAAAGPEPAGAYTDPESEAWRKGTYGGKGRYITGPDASEDLKQYLGDLAQIERSTDFMNAISMVDWKHPSEIPEAAGEVALDALLGGQIWKGLGRGAKGIVKTAPRLTGAALGGGVAYGGHKLHDAWQEEQIESEEANKDMRDILNFKAPGPTAQPSPRPRPSRKQEVRWVDNSGAPLSEEEVRKLLALGSRYRLTYAEFLALKRGELSVADIKRLKGLK